MCHNPSPDAVHRTATIAAHAIVASLAGDPHAAITAARRSPPDDLDLLLATLIAVTADALDPGTSDHTPVSSSTILTAWQMSRGVAMRISIDAVPQPARTYAQALAAALAHDTPSLHALIRAATRSSTPIQLLELLRHCVHNAGHAITRTGQGE